MLPKFELCCRRCNLYSPQGQLKNRLGYCFKKKNTPYFIYIKITLELLANREKFILEKLSSDSRRFNPENWVNELACFTQC